MNAIEGKNGPLTRTLAIAGTILVTLPIAATKVVAIAFWMRSGSLRIDWLMPAELGLVAFLGGGLLLWAARRARTRRAPVAWGLGVMFGMMLVVMVLPAATGLASGATKPEGWPWLLTIAALAVYVLAMAELIVAGCLLVWDLFRGKGGVAAPSATPQEPAGS